MTTATMAAPKSGATFGIDRLFLALALIATAILVALVLLDGQPASAALILGGFGLGIAFLNAEFSYTASWRRFLTRGEAGWPSSSTSATRIAVAISAKARNSWSMPNVAPDLGAVSYTHLTLPTKRIV